MGKQPAAETTNINPKNKVNRFQQSAKQDQQANAQTASAKNWPTDAAIYIGHLPHGFFEEELKTYFEQYGDVLAVKVCRSKKTGRSKGYAFVQFRYPEVAKIAAEAMHNYMLLGKILVCHTIEKHKVNPFTFKLMRRKTRFINWQRAFIKQRNRTRTPAEMKNEVTKLLKHEEERRNRLKELGVTYEFPGFTTLVQN